MVHLLGRERALELLALQDVLLDVFEGALAARRGVGLGALAVPASEAGGDEVSDAARLEESVVLGAGKARVSGAGSRMGPGAVPVVRTWMPA